MLIALVTTIYYSLKSKEQQQYWVQQLSITSDETDIAVMSTVNDEISTDSDEMSFDSGFYENRTATKKFIYALKHMRISMLVKISNLILKRFPSFYSLILN